MALLLVATPGSATANSYDTVANADAYFEAHPQFETWDALADSVKSRYLILATNQIDAVPLVGSKYDTTTTAGVPDQALHFPRGEDSDNGTLFIPVAVKRACYEQAVFLAERGGSVSKRRTLQLDGVQSVTIGDVTETYDTAGQAGVSHELSPRAYQILNQAGLVVHSARWA